MRTHWMIVPRTGFEEMLSTLVPTRTKGFTAQADSSGEAIDATVFAPAHQAA